MISFGIIAEGPTDQIVIENILVGFFNDADLSSYIKFLQPLRDETDKKETESFGGWFNVFEFCKSENFIKAFEQNNFLIIQIDSDVCEEKNYDVRRAKPDRSKLTDEELISSIVLKFESLFIESFGEEKYNQFKDRLIYAICVNEIECWILPLYYDNKIRSATNNCIFQLNKKIKGKYSFYIDPKDKSNQVGNYDKMTTPYMKQKVLLSKCAHNISLKVFIENLRKKNIQINV